MGQQRVLSSKFNMSVGFLPAVITILLSGFASQDISVYAGAATGIAASLHSYFRKGAYIPQIILYATTTMLTLLAVIGIFTADYCSDLLFPLMIEGCCLLVPFLIFLNRKRFLRRYQCKSSECCKQFYAQGAEAAIVSSRVILLFGFLHFLGLFAAYLLNPLKNDYAIEDVSGEYLGRMIPGRKQLFEKLSWKEAMAQKPEAFLSYAGRAASVCLQVREVLTQKLEQAGMLSLFENIEMPLSRVLYEMEKEGVLVRKEELKNYGDALVDRIGELEKAIHEAAGCEFNINSPKQLGEVLFEKMGLKGGKKTKTGYSTAADILEKLAPDHPIVADVLEYRGLTKLKSTYADGLADYIGPDGRIHTSFNQTITATGRISSTEPNLQNIPMRTQLGRLIRRVFVPREGWLFTDADYSQIELRVLAHLSGDRQLIEAYQSDADIHRITASKVFHTPFEEVTDLQRRNAKAVNFGIVYGISSFGLSQDLSITRKEAADYIEQYFQTYPDVKKFLDRQVQEAKEKGYTTTLFGRRRPVPELNSSNFMQRSFGERVAMNSPIQGTAADIIKIAMIRVWEALRKEGLSSRLILQIHDELLIETKESEAERVRQILETQMKGAADLAVSLEVDLHTGKNWYDAK